MGDPRKLRKNYTTPSHPWQKQRIDRENKLAADYGLKNKREVWRAEAIISKYRTLARHVLAKPSAERQAEEQNLLARMNKLGFANETAKIDDILALTAEAVLERRLQTRVWKKGLAATTAQARQFITHGKIAVDGRKTTAPSILVNPSEDDHINWYGEPIKFTLKKTDAALENIETAKAKSAKPLDKKQDDGKTEAKEKTETPAEPKKDADKPEKTRKPKKPRATKTKE